MIARWHATPTLNASIDGSMFHLRGLLASSMMAPVGRDGDLYLPRGKFFEWRLVSDRVFSGSVSQDHAAFSILSLVPHSHETVFDARNVLYPRARSFAVLSSTSHGSLTLKLAYPSAAPPCLSFSLSFSAFFSLSFLFERHIRGEPRRCCPPSTNVRSDRTRLQSCHGPLSKFEKSPNRFSFS